jgi:metal-sulfur cluster biosynthetic enzyme
MKKSKSTSSNSAKSKPAQKSAGNFSPAVFREVLNRVPDPELGVGIVDLGLVYSARKNRTGTVEVIITLTSMGCPLGPQIKEEIENILLQEKGVKSVNVEIVWEPAWNPDMMNPEIKTILFGNNSHGIIQYKTEQ